MRFLVALVFAYLFSSCHFYQSKVPITASEKAVTDKRLTGNWYGLEYDSLTQIATPAEEYIKLIDFNGKEYAAVMASAEELQCLRVHRSLLNGKVFLNILPIEDANSASESNPSLSPQEQQYFFFIIDSLLEDRVVMRHLTDSLKVQFSKSKDLEGFLKKNFKQLETAWLSEPFYYYRDVYFTWDRINVPKTAQLEEVWKLNENDYNLATLPEAELFQKNKESLDIPFYKMLLEQAYWVREDLKGTMENPQLLLCKFKNGEIHKIWLSSSDSKMVDLTTGKNYRIRRVLKD